MRVLVRVGPAAIAVPSLLYGRSTHLKPCGFTMDRNSVKVGCTNIVKSFILPLSSFCVQTSQVMTICFTMSSPDQVVNSQTGSPSVGIMPASLGYLWIIIGAKCRTSFVPCRYVIVTNECVARPCGSLAVAIALMHMQNPYWQMLLGGATRGSRITA